MRDTSPESAADTPTTAIKEVQQISKEPSTDSVDLIRTYLREIGRYPLLTREQEVGYGRQVQQLMSLLSGKESLTKKLRREPTAREWAEHVQLSEAELNETVRHGQRAKQKMVSANLRLVVAIAKKYQKRNMEFLDLIQEGSLGLIRGIEKFQPNKGYRLSTYCYWWIFQAISRAIAEKSRTIRLPIHVTEKLNKIKKAQRHLSQQLGRTATVSELAAQLKIIPKHVLECLERTQQPVSLNLHMGDSQDTELGDLLEDTAVTPQELIMQSELSTDLEPLMADLTPIAREVLILRFGLESGQGLTLAKVGSRLNLSRERVRQIERKALKQLRRHEAEIDDYFRRS